MPENLAPSDKARVGAQRKARLDAGWTEVRVWAAARDDVRKIREFSEALKMERLISKARQIGRERNTPPGVIDRALDAFGRQHSPEFNMPSGATLTLLTELAREDRLPDLNAVVAMFKVVHPGNARFVAGNVPAKVIHSNIPYRLDSDVVERITRWQAAHPDWAAEIVIALENFTLDAWADAAVQEMRGYDLDQGAAATE